MNKYIQQLIDRLKTRPTLLAHELNGTSKSLTTWKMTLRWTIGDDENEDPKIMEEVLLAAEQEAEAEWACNLLFRARQKVYDTCEVDCSKGDPEIYQHRLEETICAQSKDFVNPILIVSPSVLTILMSTEFFFPNSRGVLHDGRTVKFVGYYRNIPVHVDQYASDRELNLICDKGWFTAETDYGIQATSPRLDPVMFEEVVGFETDAEFNIDASRVKGFKVEFGHMMGFI